MSTISLIAKLVAAEGKAEDLRAAVTALVAAADEEPGLLVYSASEDPNAPGTIFFYELYADDEAFAAHGKGEAMTAAMGALGGLLGGRPEITLTTPFAAKGLDIG